MEVQTQFFQVFSEIDQLNERLSVLGSEAKSVLGKMLNSGVPMDMVIPFLAKARKAQKANETEVMKDNEAKEKPRCRWWNRGYCREQEGCSFSHPSEDCQEHLQGRCNTKGCLLRHRRECKFLSTEAGCHRGDMCAYLHKVEKGDKEHKNIEIETQTENTSIDNDKMPLCSTFIEDEPCLCRKDIVKNELVIKQDKIICLFNRVECTKEEWLEVEETVKESGNNLDEMLDQWSKVMEGYHRVENRKG